MTTIRQQFIDYAALIIIDSGNTDQTAIRIAGALNGAAERRPSFAVYHESIPVGGRVEKLLITAVREAVLKHPRYKMLVANTSGQPVPELERAARTVMSNLETHWRRINGDQMEIQQLGHSRVSDMLANNYRILEVALRGKQ